MVLSDVEETVTIVEVEDDNEDEAVRVSVPARIFAIPLFPFPWHIYPFISFAIANQ